MRNRSVIMVIVFTLITFGIYSLYWHVSTKNEMNEKYGADIPTAWLLLVPFANLYWIWKWCGGVERVTNSRFSQPVALLFSLLLSIIGMAVIQDAFNKSAANALPQARVA